MKILGIDRDFVFGTPSSEMHVVTCVNHTDGYYLTKGPGRGLHWIGWGRLDEENRGFVVHPEFGRGECQCTDLDLRVVLPRTEKSETPTEPVDDDLVHAAIQAGLIGIEDGPLFTSGWAHADSIAKLREDVEIAEIHELLHTNPWDRSVNSAIQAARHPAGL